jgi:hypothetical protein
VSLLLKVGIACDHAKCLRPVFTGDCSSRGGPGGQLDAPQLLLDTIRVGDLQTCGVPAGGGVDTIRGGDLLTCGVPGGVGGGGV